MKKNRNTLSRQMFNISSIVSKNRNIFAAIMVTLFTFHCSNNTFQTAIDALNEPGTSSIPIVVDYVPGANGAVDPALSSASDTGVSNTDGITNLTSVTITGSLGSTLPNGSIEVFINGISAGTATADANGNYTLAVNPLSSGQLTFVVYDSAGNSSGTPFTGGSIVVDTTAPTNQNSVFNAPLSVQSGTSVAIVPSGTSSDQIWIAPATPLLTTFSDFSAGSAMVATTGSSSVITAPATPGNYVIYIIDAAGNVSAPSTAILTVDNSIPTVVLTSTTPDGSYSVGASINITATFNEPVTLSGGLLNATLDTGVVVSLSATAYPATVLSGTYLVAALNSSPDLTVNTLATTGTVSDAAGNGANLIPVSNIAATSALIIDTTAPFISSVSSTTMSGTYGTGNSINITLNFSETVTLTGGTLTLNLNNGQTKTITTINNVSSAVATYTITSGVAESIAILDLSSVSYTGTIQDAAGNALVTTIPIAPNNLSFAMISIADIPVITSITSASPDGSYAAGSTIDVTVTYSVPVLLTAGTLNLTLDTGAILSIASFTAGTGSASYLVAPGENSADLTVTAIALSAGATLQDSVTSLNASLGLPGLSNLANNKAIVVDTTPPAVPNSLTLNTPATSPGNNTTPVITVGAVTSGDTVKLFTNNTCTTQVATGVAAGATMNLTSSALTAGLYNFYATSTDPVGNTSACSTATVAYQIDLTAPSVTSINRKTPAGTPTNVNSVIYTVTFSENVTGVATTSFALTNTSATAGTIASVSAASGTAIDVTVNTISGDGTMRLDLNTLTGITDTAGNTLAATFTTGQIYTLDFTPPAVPNSLTLNTPATSPGNNTTPVITAGAVTSGDTVALFTDSICTAQVATGVAAGATMNLTSSALTAGLYNFYATSTDPVGNISACSTATVAYQIDLTAPSVTSINRNTPAGTPTNVNSVIYTVTFSENVTGVATTSFALTNTSATAGTIASVSAASGTAIDVTVNTISGDGTMRLDLNTLTGITDTAGNTLAATFTTGQIYTFDFTPPAVPNSLTLNTPATSPGNNTTPVITVGAVTSGDTVALFTDNICTAQVATGVAAGTTINLTSSALTAGLYNFYATATDSVGNVSACSTATVAYQLDLTAPSVTSINRKTPAGTPTNVNSVIYTVTFSENVTGVATTSFALTNTSATAGTIASVFPPSGTAIDVTVNTISGDGTMRLDLNTLTGIADTAGNTLAATFTTGQIYTLDFTPPAVPNSLTLNTPATSPGNNTTPVITVGAVTSGDTVALFTDSICTAQVAIGVAAGATINLTSSALTAGLYNFYATSADPVGNVSACSTATVAYQIDLTLPTITAAETMDLNGNGKIDHYKITFSENVNDSTFPGYVAANTLGSVTAAWSAGAYTNLQLSPGTAEATGDIANDNIIFLKFAEGAVTDTGVKPDITSTATPGLQDSAGNLIAQVQGTTVIEADKALPVVISAAGTGNTTAYILFSEPISALTGEIATNYSINGGALAVTGAVMSNDGITVTSTVDQKYVILTTAPQTVGTNNYTVTVSTAVNDQSNNAIAAASGNSSTFSGQPSLFKVLSAAATSNTTVTVTFNNPVGTGGNTIGNYNIAGLTVSGAVAAGSVVTLTTTSHTSNTLNGYTVVVSNVQDTQPVVIDAAFNSATFTGDTLPRVVSAVSIDMNTVNVTFSEAVQWDTLANGALLNTNYTVNNGLTVSAAASFTPNTVVQLTTSNQGAGTLYTLTASGNIKDTQGNLIDAASKTATFTGLENIKVTTGVEVTPSGTTTYRIAAITFSKSFLTGTANNNAVDKTNAGYVHTSGASALQNWAAPAGTAIIGLCTSAHDTACPAAGFSGGNTIYLRVDDGAATPAKPAQGNYTFIASGWTGAATTVAGAAGCILPTVGTAPADCLQNNPNDRASVTFGAIPTNVGAGPVFADPFNDGVTKAGQAFVYNGKLHIGPNATYTGVFETDINMTNSTTITLDADNVTAGNQAFQGSAAAPYIPATNPGGVWETCITGTWPACTTGNYLAGIDRLIAACFSATGTVDTALTGTACTVAGGTEYLFVLGYNTTAGTTGYNTNWNTTGTISPFIFNRRSGLSQAATFTFRAMSFAVFKGWLYQASQHQGTRAIRWNRLNPAGTTIVDLNGGCIERMGAGNTSAGGGCTNTIVNGETTINGTATTGLMSMDVMWEHDNDGAGANTSQLYIANGGSCLNATAPNRCLTDMVRNTTTKSDGGVFRSTLTFSTNANPPVACTSSANCATMWEDVTPATTNWLKFMSIALPANAAAGGDWASILPANTITPAIKAIPRMANFNGDLYMIRNACASATVQTVALGTFADKQTCAKGQEVPQLWKLPANSGTVLATVRSAWVLIGNITSGKTTMAGATWSDTVNQPTYTANNTHITMLATNGTKLFIGFDNAVNGANLWRTKAGVTNPTSEADFEAVCDTGNVCSVAAKQFGFGSIGDGNATNDITRIFDAVSVNDAGTDYLVINAGDGVNPVKVYRSNNN